MRRHSRLVIDLFGKMADFVLSEAEVEDNICDDMSVVSKVRESDREFIDGAEYDQSEENYHAFDNVSEIITMQLMILCLVLIFLKKQLTIILIMKLKKR